MHELSRRSLLAGAAGATAATAAGGLTAGAAAHGWHRPPPLWKQAARNGIVFGSSIATWQLDGEYNEVHAREAALMFTEDDLLWYQLKPTPDSPLNFGPGNRMVRFAERNNQLTIGAHLAWDEGFGEGWTDDDLWGLSRRDAERLLYRTVRREVAHYKGRMNGWIVANEVTDPEERDRHGLRTNVPWYQTIGPEYVGRVFHIAEQEDPHALRIINEFGFETVNEFGDQPGVRRRTFLRALDWLLDRKVPIQAVGIQGHLLADRFAERFHERGYRAFLQEIADRDLPILITEMDVLDDGLPADISVRDRRIADVYRRYLDVTLDVRAVKAVIAFGLSDRYTWLQEDRPREDGAARRPLAFDEELRKKPAYWAIARSLRCAPSRRPLWRLEKGH
ncbi:MAG TPA: endo-1,4-beta-xylanase [Marmoricola sp.]|nr:endo-1,4-beta-xylanase [Marmoricola sp.]